MKLNTCQINFIANVWRRNRRNYTKVLHAFAESYNTNIATIHNLVWF